MSYGADLNELGALPPASIAYAVVAKPLTPKEALDYWCDHCGTKYGEDRERCYMKTRVNLRACARR